MLIYLLTCLLCSWHLVHAQFYCSWWTSLLLKNFRDRSGRETEKTPLHCSTLHEVSTGAIQGPPMRCQGLESRSSSMLKHVVCYVSLLTTSLQIFIEHLLRPRQCLECGDSSEQSRYNACKCPSSQPGRYHQWIIILPVFQGEGGEWCLLGDFTAFSQFSSASLPCAGHGALALTRGCPAFPFWSCHLGKNLGKQTKQMPCAS